MGAILNAHINKLYEKNDPSSVERQDQMHRWLLNRCGSMEKVKNIIQEVLANLLDTKIDPPDIESIGKFNDYLFTCFKNEISKQHKQFVQEERVYLIILEKLKKEKPDFLDELLLKDDEREKQLMFFIIENRLSALDRRIIKDFYLRGLTAIEVAEQLNKEGVRTKHDDVKKFTENSVGRQKLRILDKIKKQWVVTIK